jgi:hypothetical protein
MSSDSAFALAAASNLSRKAASNARRALLVWVCGLISDVDEQAPSFVRDHIPEATHWRCHHRLAIGHGFQHCH